MDIAKRILLFVLFLVGLATILLQVFVFGSDEDMVDEEYDDFQIHFDLGKMESGITSLFGGDSGSSNSSYSTGHSSGNGASGGSDSSESSHFGGSLKPAATASAMRKAD